MTHTSADVQRIALSASCMMISGGRAKLLDIFCCVTGFTGDFLSFIVVEHIRLSPLHVLSVSFSIYKTQTRE